MKSLYIFGNGLGRSFDNEFYSLERALKKSWSQDGLLDDNQRRLIQSCLQKETVIEAELDIEEAPTAENELRDLQRVVDACDLISIFQDKTDCDDAWLTDTGKGFPNAVRSYFHFAAVQFHDPNKRLPDAFADDLRSFVKSARPHIATLNYDDLLYEAFTGTSIFHDRMLRDGFLGGNFQLEQSVEYYNQNPKEEGWFLHLHGSPLFITRDRQEKKIPRSQLSSYAGHEKTHLVLTHAKSKPTAIMSSPILKGYWHTLRNELKNSTKVTLFGYGGADDHLNQILNMTGDNVSVRVVSYKPDDPDSEIQNWKKIFNKKDLKDSDVLLLDNLMDFSEWE